jgi:hypothetical protein
MSQLVPQERASVRSCSTLCQRTAAKTRWQECDHERQVVEAVVSAHVAMYVLGGGEWMKRLGSDDVTRLLAGAGTSEASERPGEG